MTNWVNETKRQIAEQEGRALDWNDTIERESNFILLPDGIYPYTVLGFERGRHNGSANLPACPKAVVECLIKDREGNETKVKNNLFLHTKTEPFLSAFFTSIGQKKKGEPLKMDWSKVTGSTGKCKLGHYESQNGNVFNDIKEFLPPEDVDFTPGKF